MTKLLQGKSGFGLFLAASLLAGWRPLAQTLALSLHDDQYTYILLIFPVSAGLLFLEWRSVRTTAAPAVGAGAVFLSIAILMACFAQGWFIPLSSDVQLSTRMFALVLGWVGAFVLWFGAKAARAVLFPLCFLFALVPLPRIAMDEVVFLLQEGSAWAAHALFAAFGIPVVQTGVLLTIPGLTVEVAQECSSIRSSSMLLVTTIVLAQLMLRGPWRKLLVIGLAIPLSIAKNGLRVFTIAMLATRVDRGYLSGRLHREGGIIFFALALLGIFALLWIFRRGDNRSPTSDIHDS